MSFENYQNASLEDFLLDKFFQESVRTPTEEKESFWETCFLLYPDQRSVWSEARRILQIMDRHTGSREATPDEIRDSWKKLMNSQNQPQAKFTSVGKQWMKYAAAAILILAMGMSMWIVMHDPDSGWKTYVTGYGEKMHLQLPDGSVVDLNANSKLRFLNSWENEEVRQVWIEGEAFFDVVHFESPSRDFIVHADKLQVKVLGTQFNVNSREKGTQVVLETGKISLQVEEATEEILMAPGEMVEYRPSSKVLERSQVKPANIVAWKDGMLVFEDVPLYKATERLEEIYGKTIEIRSDSLANTNVRLSAPAHDLQSLLEDLKLFLNLEVQESNESIILK